MPVNNQVGQKIRTLREMRNITVEDLCQRCGMKAEQITALEEGKAPASLTPLLQIARGMGVRLGTFLDDSDLPGPVLTKGAGTAGGVRFVGTCDKNGLEFHTLAAGKRDRNMEPFIIDVHPPMNEKYELSSHEGEEFIYVLAGKIEVQYGKQRFTVEQGDSIYYDSVVPHHLHSVQGVESRILAVVYAPH